MIKSRSLNPETREKGVVRKAVLDQYENSSAKGREGT